jgi:hypothetical protein
MSVLTQHPRRVVSLAFAAMAVAAFAFNGPVAAGESADSSSDSVAVVSEVVGDLAPMIEPMEDVDDSGDAAPMIEPMEDVDDSDVSGDVAPMIEPMEDVDE